MRKDSDRFYKSLEHAVNSGPSGPGIAKESRYIPHEGRMRVKEDDAYPKTIANDVKRMQDITRHRPDNFMFTFPPSIAAQVKTEHPAMFTGDADQRKREATRVAIRYPQYVVKV